MEILTQNTKLRATSKELGVKVMNFGIPAYRSRVSGKVICPFAKDCVKYCYAQKGAYNYGNVHPVFEKRYELTKQDNFVDLMCEEIKRRSQNIYAYTIVEIITPMRISTSGLRLLVEIQM